MQSEQLSMDWMCQHVWIHYPLFNTFMSVREWQLFTPIRWSWPPPLPMHVQKLIPLDIPSGTMMMGYRLYGQIQNILSQDKKEKHSHSVSLVVVQHVYDIHILYIQYLCCSWSPEDDFYIFGESVVLPLAPPSGHIHAAPFHFRHREITPCDIFNVKFSVLDKNGEKTQRSSVVDW